MLFGKTENIVLKVEGMHCMHCAAKVEAALKALKGVKKAQVTLEKGTVSVDYVAAKVNGEAMVNAVKAAGFSAELN